MMHPLHPPLTPRATLGSESLCHWRHANQRRWATACQQHLTRTGEEALFAFCPYCGRRLLMDRSNHPPVEDHASIGC